MNTIIQTVADHTLPHLAREKAYQRPLSHIGLSRIYRCEGWEQDALRELPDMVVVTTIEDLKARLELPDPSQLLLAEECGMSLHTLETMLEKSRHPKIIFISVTGAGI